MDVETDDNFLLFSLLFMVIDTQESFIIIMSTYIKAEYQLFADFINMLLISCKVNNFPSKNLPVSVEIYG